MSDEDEHAARPSIAVRLIRHAESRNNQVYRDARRLFGSGTADCDKEGWMHYVSEHRRADPGLSDVGYQQAQVLADYLVPTYFDNEGKHNVSVIVSPMRRTCETIRPALQQAHSRPNIIVNAFYFETEGCHTNGVAEEGMAPSEIENVLFPKGMNDDAPSIQFEGFQPSHGWWLGETNETRAQAELRAAKFFLWLCEHLDNELAKGGIPDASVHPAHGRNVQLVVGHGDFMSLVLSRIVTSFGHAVEAAGVPHRSAFVHWNTGITELEYFGRGRFLIMRHNSTPHFVSPALLTGGSLQDGWSYLMPQGYHEVDVSSAQLEALPLHVLEQRDALKSLYLKTATTDVGVNSSDVSVEDEHHFIVRKGHQVVGVATYCAQSGFVSEVAIRPSAGTQAAEQLFSSIKECSDGRKLRLRPNDENSRELLSSVGFVAVSGDIDTMEFQH